MAGESLSYTELKNWYDTFNTVISNYGGNIEQLIVPTQGKAKPNDINNLLNKITELANEEYLGTQPSLYLTDYSVVSSGSKILRSSITPISNTASNLSSISCRNKISYSCGTNSCGNKSNGSDNCGTWGNGTCSNGTCSNGTKGYGANTNNSQPTICSSGTCSSGTRSNGYNSKSTKSTSTKTNGVNSNSDKSNGAIYDILNANTSY